ncbi:MAG: hypothetical protein LBU27_03255 [Candidatus Peribacteria bacterium]|jgi:hypothetical protein|nr:hypothetical protein [Candidatus Peribacteria bacterium]
MGEIYDKTPLYFVINDTLYEAGEREFAGIKNDTVTVQRISNLVENTETMKSTFTLETCEVDLM